MVASSFHLKLNCYHFGSLYRAQLYVHGTSLRIPLTAHSHLSPLRPLGAGAVRRLYTQVRMEPVAVRHLISRIQAERD